MRCALAIVILAGCGRVAFDARGDASMDTGPDRANRVFVTNALQPGGFGGLAVADATCAAEAAAAGLPGTFVAFLATAAMPDPRSRLAGSRGWALVDGTPVGTTVESMLDTFEVYNPLAMLADGTPLTGNATTWTGTSATGVYEPTQTCNDWMASTAGFVGCGNNVRNASWAGGAFVGCDNSRRFLCFETGHVADVAPVPSTGRLVFITVGKRMGATLDISAADTMCSGEAASAGFPGTYRAAMSTTTTSIESRFTLDTRPFIRVDGTRIAAPSVFFTGMNLTSFGNQLSNGTYTTDNYYTGVESDPQTASTLATTCQNWASTNVGNTGQSGEPAQTLGSQFWGAVASTCDTRLRFLCVQE
jgi:hypothetical protein